MANKSSKSPTGEDREHNAHIREQEVEKKDITLNSGEPVPGPSQRGKQENLKNRGYEEDHPQHPARTTGSTEKHQETLPTGEPDPDEV